MNINGHRRVVVTGLGTFNPLGKNVSNYWNSLIQGKSGIRQIKNYPIDQDYPVQIGGEVDVDPEDIVCFKRKKDAERLDPYIVIGYIAAIEAFADSHLDVDKAPDRYGSLIGCGGGGVHAHWKNVSKINRQNMSGAHLYYVSSAINSTLSGYVSQAIHTSGPCFAVSSACASSNHSFGTAAMMIKNGMADAMFAGGSEAALTPNGLASFGNIRALTTRNDSPETASRPFDTDRDGFVMSNGAGVVLLEELEHAKKRGAVIYCEMTGFGFTCDAYDLFAPHPEGIGASKAINMALEQARLLPEDIDLINAHATSTQVGDMAETMAIRRSFKQYALTVPVQSTKSMTGHTLGAAGGLEAIAVAQTFKNNIAHHTINQFNQDPDIPLNVIKNEPMQMSPKHILSNTFGFGGQNACVIFSRFDG